MAVVYGMRLAIWIAPRAVRYVHTPQAAGAPSVGALYALFRDRLHDADELDEELSEDLSTSAGYSVLVATYTGDFELRKVVMQFTHADAAAITDDVRQASFHVAKLSGGLPSAAWVQADFDAVAGAVDTLWTSLKSWYPSYVKYDRIKFYKAGPSIVPPNPPAYEADKDVAGTGAGNSQPPQVAVSVTEMAGTKPHWGRLYMPPPIVGSMSPYGRYSVGVITAFADAFDVMYTALSAGSLPVVVYRATLPERTKKNGTVLPARAASAWTVEKVQVDDVVDVIRSRRWKYPTLKIQREIS